MVTLELISVVLVRLTFAVFCKLRFKDGLVRLLDQGLTRGALAQSASAASPLASVVRDDTFFASSVETEVWI